MTLLKITQCAKRSLNNASLIVTLALALTACATPYDTEKNFWSFGKGFETIQISSNSWLISFVGNANTDRVVTRKYVMLKSAELCQKAGYTYFVFNNEQTYLDQVGHFRVGTKASDVLLGSAVVDTETSTVVEVRGLKERPKDQNVLVYDASYIVDHFSVNS